MNKLKDAIFDVVKNDNYELSDLQKVLHPVTTLINNPVFEIHLKKITQVILKDRDGNNQFTVDDLKLLSSDMNALYSIVSALLLITGSVQKTVLKYNNDDIEHLVFKLLAYVFLVVVPKETKKTLTLKEKEDIIVFVLDIYDLIKSAQITKNLIDRVNKWFRKKGWYNKLCCGSYENSIETVDRYMPVLQVEIYTNMQKNKEITRINSNVLELQKLLSNITVGTTLETVVKD